MGRGFPPNDEVESGKAAILRHVQAVMANSGIDPKLLVAMWRYEPNYAQWILRLLRGRSRFELQFAEQDIMVWPRYKDLVARPYETMIRGLMERLKAALGREIVQNRGKAG